MTDKQFTIVEHLAELRKSLIICFASIFAGAVICYAVHEKLLGFLMKPAGKLVFIAPHEAFIAYIKISLLAGVFLSLPVIIWQVWKFVSIALTSSEKKYIFYYMPFFFFLFFGGSAFAYFLILPLGMRFLLGFATETLQPMISVSKYISFAGMILLTFGVVFELPLVMMFLTKIHIVTPQFLKAKRKVSLIVIFIVAALLTPPDMITQCLMAGPLIVLYEVSILLSKLVYKKHDE